MREVAKKEFYIIVAGVVGVLLLLGAYWVWGPSREEVVTLETGEVLRTAREGQIVRSFPRDLLLESGVDVEESYSLEYQEGVTQPVIEYASTISLEENITRYRDHLLVNDWEIVQEASIGDAPITYFYATRDNEQVNITFTEASDYTVTVRISYVVEG